MADLYGMMMDGLQAGRDGYQRGQQTKLAGLVGQAYSAPAEQRQQLLGQVAQTSPQAAFDAQKHFSGMDDNARQRLGQYAAAFDALPDDQKPMAYPQLAQQAQVLGIPAPSEWRPEYAPNISKLAQTLGGGGSGTPAGLQEFQYMASGLSPEDQLKARRVHLGLDPKQSSAAINYQKMVGPDGREYFIALDPRAVGAQVVGGGPHGMEQVQYATSDGQPIPANEQDAAQAAFAANARGEDFTIPVGGRPQVGNPFASRRVEDTEYAKQSAQEQAKLNYLPQQEAVKADAAIRQAGGAEEARQTAQSRVELAQMYPKVVSDSTSVIKLIDKALNHPGRETATGASFKYDPRNYLPGSDATNFRVLADQLRGGTFLQAFQSLKGAGAITQVEGTKAEQAIARLEQAQSDEEFVVALQELRAIAEKAPMLMQAKLDALGNGMPAPRDVGGGAIAPQKGGGWSIQRVP